jgi:putative restriction endonuclease
MAYWWVSQNHTFKQERAGGYLWAPKTDRGGGVPYHWQTMTEVQPGDVVFSYVAQRIPAIAVESTSAYDSPKPGEFGASAPWEENGRRIDAQYQDLSVPLEIPPIAINLKGLLSHKYSPLTETGAGTQGYLFWVPPRAGRYLLELIDPLTVEEEPTTVAIERANTLPATERQALVKSRIGQGPFREALVKRWDGRCAVTGFAIVKLLRASHIKPWRDSNHAERLDPYNGLLLAPGYDAAFDLRDLSPEHMAYLAYHRSEVFLK